MSEYPEALVARVTKALYISPVSDHWGETVPEIAAVCERAAIASLDALGLREEEQVNHFYVLTRRRRYVTDWEDA